MATRFPTRQGMTLEAFLKWPRIDEKPYLEYCDGRIEVKVSPQRRHGVIEKNMTWALDRFAAPAKLGAAYPELRCTFGGRSIVPDVVFQLEANIPVDEMGLLLDESVLPPDIHVEIRSPDQSARKTREKLEHSIANGCPLGWYIDPERRTVDVYRPGMAPQRLAADGHLDGAPVLPGFGLSVEEIFGWLGHRTQPPAGPGADPR